MGDGVGDDGDGVDGAAMTVDGNAPMTTSMGDGAMDGDGGATMVGDGDDDDDGGDGMVGW